MNYLPNSSLPHRPTQGIVTQSAGTTLTLGRAKMTKIHYLSYCRDFNSILMICMTIYGHHRHLKSEKNP